MKQRIINHLDSIKEDLFSLGTALFCHKEDAFKKLQALLDQQGFSITNIRVDDRSLLQGSIYGGKGPAMGFFIKQTTLHQHPEEKWNISIAGTMSIGAALGIASILKDIGGGVHILSYPWDQEDLLLEEKGWREMDGAILLKAGEKTSESGGNIHGFINNATLNRLLCHNLKEAGIIEIHGAKDNSISFEEGRLSNRLPIIIPRIGIQGISPERYIPMASEDLSSPARETILKGSQSAAFTVFDILSNKGLYKEMIQEFRESNSKI